MISQVALQSFPVSFRDDAKAFRCRSEITSNSLPMRPTRRNSRRSGSRHSDNPELADLFSGGVQERLQSLYAQQKSAVDARNEKTGEALSSAEPANDSVSGLEKSGENKPDPGTSLPESASEVQRTDSPQQLPAFREQNSAVSVEQNRDSPLHARALNEFVYCRRLFYYEFVEGVFVESADTLRGASIHRRVDSGTGAMPEPMTPKFENGDVPESGSVAAETIHSRSVSLGSERLGVTAKLDLVEVQASESGESPSLLASEVSPVDYKAGSPRVVDEVNELWPTDKMQLGLQILLLRENGYNSRTGIIYYRGTKQRVPLEMTSELETWILEQIVAARQVAAGPIPPPLVDSPKCVRCSLNSVCLPDETRILSELSAEQLERTGDRSRGVAVPRRLIAPRDDERVLYLNKPGLRVGRKDELLVVKEENKTLEEVRIADVGHVSLFGNIQLTTQAVQILCEKRGPDYLFFNGRLVLRNYQGTRIKKCVYPDGTIPACPRPDCLSCAGAEVCDGKDSQSSDDADAVASGTASGNRRETQNSV